MTKPEWTPAKKWAMGIAAALIVGAVGTFVYGPVSRWLFDSDRPPPPDEVREAALKTKYEELVEKIRAEPKTADGLSDILIHDLVDFLNQDVSDKCSQTPARVINCAGETGTADLPLAKYRGKLLLELVKFNIPFSRFAKYSPSFAFAELEGETVKPTLDPDFVHLSATQGTTTSGIDLRGANLKNAILRSCRLGGANLAGADLSGATIVDCDFTSSQFCYASLKTANIQGDLTTFKFADLRHADLTSINFEPGSSPGLPFVNDFDGAEIDDPQWGEKFLVSDLNPEDKSIAEQYTVIERESDGARRYFLKRVEK